MTDTTKKARELLATELRKNRDYLKPAIDDDGEECKSFATYMVEQVEAGKLDGSAEMRAIIAALSEKEQAAVPEGYALVPVEPTEGMLDAASNEPVGAVWSYSGQHRDDASPDDARRVWAAMLAAAKGA